MRFMHVNLWEKDRRKYLAAVLEQVLQACPKDMEKEKTELMLTRAIGQKGGQSHTSLAPRCLSHNRELY